MKRVRHEQQETNSRSERLLRRGPIINATLLLIGLTAIAVSARAQVPVLADAMENRDESLIRRLLDEASANVNLAQVDGMTALHWAAYYDDAELAGMLVRSGAEVNAENRYGVPPLALAASNSASPQKNSALPANI